MEREREYIKPRNPTADNDPQRDLQKKEMRKKLYRKESIGIGAFYAISIGITLATILLAKVFGEKINKLLK